MERLLEKLFNDRPSFHNERLAFGGRAAVSSLLAFAAASKASGTGGDFASEILVALTVVDLAVAICIWFPSNAICAFVSSVFFSSGATFSVISIANQTSCSCVGNHEISPWIYLSFHCFCLVSIWIAGWMPSSKGVLATSSVLSAAFSLAIVIISFRTPDKMNCSRISDCWDDVSPASADLLMDGDWLLLSLDCTCSDCRDQSREIEKQAICGMIFRQGRAFRVAYTRPKRRGRLPIWSDTAGCEGSQRTLGVEVSLGINGPEMSRCYLISNGVVLAKAKSIDGL